MVEIIGLTDSSEGLLVEAEAVCSDEGVVTVWLTNLSAGDSTFGVGTVVAGSVTVCKVVRGGTGGTTGALGTGVLGTTGMATGVGLGDCDGNMVGKAG